MSVLCCYCTYPIGHRGASIAWWGDRPFIYHPQCLQTFCEFLEREHCRLQLQIESNSLTQIVTRDKTCQQQP